MLTYKALLNSGQLPFLETSHSVIRWNMHMYVCIHVCTRLCGDMFLYVGMNIESRGQACYFDTGSLIVLVPTK